MFKYTKLLAKLTAICGFVLTTFVFFTPVYAQSTTPTQTPADIYNQNCGSKIKNAQYNSLYQDLINAQKYDQANPQKGNTSQNSVLLQAGCPPSFEDISYLVLRIITILITLVGLIVVFMFMRGSIMIMTAGANKDKVKKGNATLQNTIVGLVIILISYTAIVFIASRLGLAGDPNQFSILDGPNLIFNFVFKY